MVWADETMDAPGTYPIVVRFRKPADFETSVNGGFSRQRIPMSEVEVWMGDDIGWQPVIRQAEAAPAPAAAAPEAPLVLSRTGRFIGDTDIPAADVPTWEAQVAGIAETGEPGIRTSRVGDHITVLSRADDGSPNGILTFDVDDAGRVQSPFVVVRPDARRQGIATRLYDQAEAEGFDIAAASGINTTAEGAAFVAARRGPEAPTTPSQTTAAPQGATALPGGPTAAEPTTVFISRAIEDLYSRYMHGETGHAPQSVGEVLQALHDLDFNVPSVYRAGAKQLEIGEMVELRQALAQWMDEALARRGSGEQPPPRRAGEWMEPEVYAAELQGVLQALPRIVLNDPGSTPLRGFEGTQYEFGPVPADTQVPLMFEELFRASDDILPDLADELLMGRRQGVGGPGSSRAT